MSIDQFLHRREQTVIVDSPMPESNSRAQPRGGTAKNLIRFLRLKTIAAWRLYYVHIRGMDIAPSASFSLKAKFDGCHPRGIHIGADSYIALGVVMLTHDMTRNIRADTIVGARCFIGANSVLLPGIHVGDGSIVGAGSVVTKNVPPGSIVAGNPAAILRSGIQTFRYGCLIDYGDGSSAPPGPRNQHWQAAS